MKNKQLIFLLLTLLMFFFSAVTVAARDIDDLRPIPTLSQIEQLVQSDHARGEYLLLDPNKPDASYPNPPEERIVHLPLCEQMSSACGTPEPRP